MKNPTRIATGFAIALLLQACDSSSPVNAEKDQAKQTKKMMNEAQRQIGMPNIVNFQERKLMSHIIELRDKEDLVTYAYIVNLDGDLIYLGQCVGYGLPYSVQFTNPEKIERRAFSDQYVVIPQSDPNGLYMPNGLSATWLMMLDPNTREVRPVYVEPEIIVSPFRLHAINDMSERAG